MKGKTAKTKKDQRKRRHARVRSRITGTAERPRLSIFRSNRHMVAQLINDQQGVTIASAHDGEIKTTSGKDKGDKIFTKVVNAREVGLLLAGRAKEKKVVKVVFDRGGYRYTGRVQAIAEGAREGGLEF